MTLRRKTILIMTVTLLGLVLLLYLVFRMIMLDSYSSLEQHITLRNLDRARNSLQNEIDALGRSIHDWSSWDDTYQFAQDDNSDFAAVNLTDNTFWSLNINLMLFVNADNEIVYGKAVDLDPNWQNMLLPTFEDYVRSDARFLRLTTATATHGLIVVGGEPLMIASRPILHNDDSGPAGGTLIWARHLGMQELANLSESLKLSLDLRSLFFVLSDGQRHGRAVRVRAITRFEGVNLVDSPLLLGESRLDRIGTREESLDSIRQRSGPDFAVQLVDCLLHGRY